MTRSADPQLRLERPDDFARIRAVTLAAFSASAHGHHGEAALVERLRANCSQTLSLVAESEGQLVGHALFSPVSIEGCDALAGGMGLGPVSVLPGFQRRGIGSHLIREGLAVLRARNTPYVCVLGDPAFYGRFGFEPADQCGVYSEFGGASDGAFRILWLVDRPPSLAREWVKYRPEFSELA